MTFKFETKELKAFSEVVTIAVVNVALVVCCRVGQYRNTTQ